MTVLRSILLFSLAALAEVSGAWLVWQGVREHRGLTFVGAGILALGGYGFVAIFQADSHFGRIPSWCRPAESGSSRSGPASPTSRWRSRS
jgi:hypothetical protein